MAAAASRGQGQKPEAKGKSALMKLRTAKILIQRAKESMKQLSGAQHAYAPPQLRNATGRISINATSSGTINEPIEHYTPSNMPSPDDAMRGSNSRSGTGSPPRMP